jgi:hypothetical protein
MRSAGLASLESVALTRSRRLETAESRAEKDQPAGSLAVSPGKADRLLSTPFQPKPRNSQADPAPNVLVS